MELATDAADDPRDDVRGHEVAFGVSREAIAHVPTLRCMCSDSQYGGVYTAHCAPEAVQFIVAWAEWASMVASGDDGDDEAALAAEMDADMKRDTGRQRTMAHAREMALMEILRWNPLLMTHAATLADALGMERLLGILTTAIADMAEMEIASALDGDGLDEDARDAYAWARACVGTGA